MKKLILTTLLVLLLPLISQAAVKKDPGAPVNVSWTYLVTNEPLLTGFRVYVGPTAAGPFTFNGTTTAPNLRTVSFPAVFATNTVRIFVQIRAYKTVGTDTVESVGAPGDTEVELNVPPPTGTLVK